MIYDGEKFLAGLGRCHKSLPIVFTLQIEVHGSENFQFSIFFFRYEVTKLIFE